MRIPTLLTLAATATLSLAPAYANDRPGDDCCGGDPANRLGSGAHHRMAMGHHGGMAPGHKRMHLGAHHGPMGWHPNRLRAAAIDFLAADVYRLAILPFNDVTPGSPVGTWGDAQWNERELRDTLAGALLETGILVLPAENVEAALRELKGVPASDTRHQGEVFRNTFGQMDLSESMMRLTVPRVARTMAGLGLDSDSEALSQMNLDYTPEEIRLMADVLDVDGFIMGSFSTLGVETRKPEILGGLINDKRGELAAMVYVVDGATGEPIYGKRVELKTKSEWLKNRKGREVLDTLVDDFSMTIMRDLSHPVPAMFVHHLRERHDLAEKPMPRRQPERTRRRAAADDRAGATADHYSVDRPTENNLHDWKEEGMRNPDRERDDERARNRDRD
ncbi:MAG TPA: hypothetical protein VEI97_04590 [bacterium]|nr:hypothetical protein [bacterium]